MIVALHHSRPVGIVVSERHDHEGLDTMINRISTAIRRQAAYARTRNELSRLTDRELLDLGIRRSDIRSVARAGVASL